VLQFEPDYETRTWQMADIDTGLAIGGAQLPWETYFTYGTPNKLSLADHIVQFSGATAPPAPDAAEELPEAIAKSSHVSQAPVS
jgi:hypothetical protein